MNPSAIDRGEKETSEIRDQMPRKHPECDPEKVKINEIRGHVPSIQAKCDPGKEETSEIRGHVQAIPIKINPGKENISEIRGQAPGITARFAILKSEREICKKVYGQKRISLLV